MTDRFATSDRRDSSRRLWVRRHCHWRVTILVAACSLVLSADSAQAQAVQLPSFKQISQAIGRHFEANPKYRSGDLIARSEVVEVLGHLRRMGWAVPDAKNIADRTLADTSFLVRQLRSPKGVPFMRQVAALPDGYDRVDRLSRLDMGRETVRALIRGPDGYKMIQYMTEASGGKEMGKMLSRVPNGANFNKPTKTIYTVAQLIEALKESYELTQKQLARSTP